MGYNFEYHPDGRLRFAHDLLDNKFDRSYSYDHVGRLETAFVGKEARGETLGPFDRGHIPYRQTFNYDAFGNMTLRDGYFWQGVQSDSATYINDRRQGWSHDNSGNVLNDVMTGTHTYDCANRQAKFMSKHTVYSSETGFKPSVEIETNYDGDGYSIKRIETRRDENVINPDQLETIVVTTYYLRSSALGGAVISELGDDGSKQVGYIYDASGERLAKFSGYMQWYHFPGGTGSWIQSNLGLVNPGSTRFAHREEMDPLGADVGTSSPFPDPPPYRDRETYLYIDGGDPFDYSGGCELDGLPISCSKLQRRIEDGAVQAVGPKGVPGDVIHLGGGLVVGRYGTGSHLDDEGDRVTDYRYFYGSFAFGSQWPIVLRVRPQPTPAPQKPICYITLVAKKIGMANKYGVGLNAYHLFVLTKQSGENMQKIFHAQGGDDGNIEAASANYPSSIPKENYDYSDVQEGKAWGSVEAVDDVAGSCDPINRNLQSTIDAINAAKIRYDMWGDNSNATAYTLLYRLDKGVLDRLDRKLFPKLLFTMLFPSSIPPTPPIVPGWRRNLLSR